MPQLQFHAWADAKLPQINPMVWVTGAHEVAALVAASIARGFTAKPPEKRVLLIVPAIAELWRGDPVRLVSQGLNISTHLRWFTSLYEELDRRGARPAFIFTDEEFGFSTWALLDNARNDDQRVQIMKRFYDDPAIRAKMPPKVLNLTPQTLLQHRFDQGEDSPYVLWNQWAYESIVKLIRQAVFEPAQKVWPGFTGFSNYQDVTLTFLVADLNGWPVASTTTPGWCSPELYFIPGNAHQNRPKNPFWYRLIQNLNLVRSCIASGRPVIPWVSYPSYNKPTRDPQPISWLWQIQTQHLIESGLDRFIYWNPVPMTTHPDNAIVAEVVDKQQPLANPPKNLPPIVAEVEQITTGNVTTTYPQFRDNFSK